MLISESDARPDLAIFINSYIPHRLAHIYTNTIIIHLSTNCVFSGKRGGYLETDAAPDGETVYDRSKALGEIVNDKDKTLSFDICPK